VKTLIPPAQSAKHAFNSAATFLIFGCCIAAPGQAAAPDFQEFLFTACSSAGGDLARRCAESVNGDLSGDSEDSLNPTQSLSFNAMATDETRARINALQEKLRQRRDEQTPGNSSEDDQSAMSVFQLSGISGLLQGESSHLDRGDSENERGYETDTFKLQLGVDYRLTDNWLVGAMISIEESETSFDGDEAGVNFEPDSSEGGSDSDGYSITFFSSKIITDTVYIEGLASYGISDYAFERTGVFQESTRNPSFNRSVNTSASTEGNQFALSAGLGAEHPLGRFDLSYYINLDYQKSSIDAYSENGGEGFAMAVGDVSSEHTIGTLGARLSRPFNASGGVWVPKIFVELEQVLDDDRVQTSSQFLDDESGAAFRLSGDTLDKARWRAGFSLLTVRPNGWMGFISYSAVQGDTLKDEQSIHAGLRIEF